MAATFKLIWGGVTIVDDSAGDIVTNIRLNDQRVAQLAEGLRALAASSFDRGNANFRLSFTNRRPPQTAPVKATQFIFDHAIARRSVVPPNDAALTLDDKGYTLKSAVVRSAEGGQVGTTTTHDYEVVFGDLSQP